MSMHAASTCQWPRAIHINIEVMKLKMPQTSIGVASARNDAASGADQLAQVSSAYWRV